MLLAFWLLPAGVSAAGRDFHDRPVATLESFDHAGDCPQWGDLGMEDILAVGGQSSVRPPSPVRLSSHGRRLAGGNSQSPRAGRSNSSADEGLAVALLRASRCGCVGGASLAVVGRARGYLRLIRCLRL